MVMQLPGGSNRAARGAGRVAAAERSWKADANSTENCDTEPGEDPRSHSIITIFLDILNEPGRSERN
jgi:hypothetical protein